ncbi:midasin [Histoplasma ohiense]|nr:midasin [Histoplasma ohiense (nom. inval.)]
MSWKLSTACLMTIENYFYLNPKKSSAQTRTLCCLLLKILLVSMAAERSFHVLFEIDSLNSISMIFLRTNWNIFSRNDLKFLHHSVLE